MSDKKMTKEEAENLKSFDFMCTCGGYAHSMNGRNPADPHMDYCKQKQQYNEWYRLTNGKGRTLRAATK